MVHRGSVGRVGGVGVAVLLLAVVMAFHAVARAGADVAPCQQHSKDSAERARLVTGTGSPVLVVGDSWSVGLGLADPAESWPSRLDGTVRVAAFSGSGFSAHASPCRGSAFAARTDEAVRAEADLVVVEGGLNDFNQSDSAIESGFVDLMDQLSGHRVVILGPAAAPARAAALPRVEALLERLSSRHHVAYISTSDLRLDYLEDQLHLTAAGHREFGDAVSERLASVVPARPFAPGL